MVISLIGCTKAQVIPNTYDAEIIQIGGEGSQTITKNAWNTTENEAYADMEAASLIFARFNTPGDVMWANCKEGYAISACKSDTNDVMPDHNPGCGILLGNQDKNVVQISCSRSPTASSGEILLETPTTH